MLLKAVLLAYSQGMVSSRAIERACRDNVVFIALTGDAKPHFTTIADFVSRSREAIAAVFAQVLTLLDGEGLIGREMFAIDGVKLPSNASKHCSGTRAEFLAQAQKMERAATTMLKCHQANDAGAAEDVLDAKAAARIERLTHEATKIRQWLTEHPDDRPGARGKVRKSNRTDNESANLAALAEKHIDALIADNAMRRRDERFAEQDKYLAKPDPLHDKTRKPTKPRLFGSEDFIIAPDQSYATCPAGKRLHRNGKDCTIGGYAAIKFRAPDAACKGCPTRSHGGSEVPPSSCLLFQRSGESEPK